MKKEKFFKNIFYIILYAICGTLANFFVTYIVMYLINKAGFSIVNGLKFSLTQSSILYYSSTMCASDVVAALTLIKPNEQPRLFSIISGEGLLNDAIAIILFDSVDKVAGPN